MTEQALAEWLRNPAYRDSHRRALEKKARRGDPVAKDALTVLAAYEALAASKRGGPSV